MSAIYRTICRVGDKVVYPVLPTFAKPMWNHPVGPKTVFFWAPTIKWALVGAGLADLARPAEKLSVSQNLALAATGLIWTRYCLVITPINYYLSSVNFFVGCTGLAQLARIFHYRYTHPNAVEPVAQSNVMSDDEDEVPSKKVARLSSTVLQLKFMKATANELEKEKKRTRPQRFNGKRIHPTVLKPDDDPVVDMNGVTREERFTRLEKLNSGRFSFRGQNPEVEKMMAVQEQKNRKLFSMPPKPRIIKMKFDGNEQSKEAQTQRFEDEVLNDIEKELISGFVFDEDGDLVPAKRSSKEKSENKSEQTFVPDDIPFSALEMECFPCPLCENRIFLTANGLESHGKEVHPNEVDKLSLLIERIQQFWSPKEAPEAVKEPAYQVCKTCGVLIDLSMENALQQHEQYHNENNELREQLDQRYGADYVQKMLVCEACNLCFANEKSRTKHTNQVHTNKWTEVRLPISGVIQREEADNHVVEEEPPHSVEPLNYEQSKSFNIFPSTRCPVCSENFSQVSTIAAHMRNYHGLMEFSSTINNLTNAPSIGYVVRNGQIYFQCCNEEFESKDQFHFHRQKVHGCPPLRPRISQ